MQCIPPVMRPNAARLRELRGDRDIRDIGASAGVDWRTLAIFEGGQATDRFQYNTINQLAHFYGVPIDAILEEVPASASGKQLRRRAIEQTIPAA